MTIQEQARMLRDIIERLSIYLTDEEGLEAVEFFPHWKADAHEYEAGDRVSYRDVLYKCLQTHTSQSDWTPDTAVSLWVRVDNPAEEWPEWRQPTGAHDAYEQGAKVSHNGKHWISDIPANVYEPGVYGWSEAI